MNFRFRTRLGALLAALPLLASTPLLAGTFDDPSSIPSKLPKKDKAHKEGEILVKFKASVPAAVRDAKHAQEGNLKLRELKRSGVHLVKTSPARKIEEVVARYRADANVEYAEPNYIVQAMRLPNEPSFNLLWGLNNNGQTLGAPGADIRALEAWDFTTGSAGVAVMVIDTGIDYTHPDLAPNIWVNGGEIPGNGIDDDGNGYIDDVNGIDVINGDSNPMDDYGHGTHVAGTIGAVGNNSQGVVGVSWNVRLIPCKFLDAGGNGTVDRAVECLEYARALKTRAVNPVNIVATQNSYGGLGAVSQTMREAIDAQRDILFFAAAGNFGLDNDTVDFFPADFDLPNVVSVAATDHNDLPPSFSNFGRRSVHLGAPGANVWSTTLLGGYVSASGTSMAAPHATGVAALLAAQDPARDWRAIRNLLLAGGQAKDSLAGKTITGRRLDAASALNCANKPLFSVVRLPAAFTVGAPATVSALSINCGAAVGPVSATTSGGQGFTLRDDGVAPDAAAGDGEFTATFTPGQGFAYIDFASAAGAERISVLDLALASVSGPANANHGEAITVGTTLVNPSTTAAPASTLDLYLSVDGVITSADTLLGSVATPVLASGAQQVVSASVTVPAAIAAGTYFIGAIVDPANLLDEGDENNNARAGNALVIGGASVDLTVSSASAPSTGFTGDPIAILATVANLGSSTAPASTLYFFLAADPVNAATYTLIGTAAAGALAGGASQTVGTSVPIPASLPPGNYAIVAVADATAAVRESNENNNSRVGNTITTSTRPVDLELKNVGGPGTARDQAPITLQAEIRNQGAATAPGSTVLWVLSVDPVITTADIALASKATSSLASGKAQKLSTTATIPAGVPAGTYYLGAIVDPDGVLAETSKRNNALTGDSITVSYSVDLVMTAVAGPGSGATGQSVAFTGTLKNQGLAATADGVTVGFYVSSDTAITTGDALIASTTVGPIAAGASVPVTATATLRTTLAAGTYTVGAIADPGSLVSESVEGNNERAGNTMSISYGPDLVMTAVAGPTSASRGQVVTLTGTVRNQGVGSVGALSIQDVLANGSAIRVGLFLSNNPTITADDIQIGSYTLSAIPGGASIPISISVTLPSSLKPGTYTIGAIADFSNAVRESDDLNNALAGNTIAVK